MTDKEVLLLRRKLDLLLRTGKLLMESAADTNRIERNMKRVAAFMGIPEEKLHIDIRWTMIMAVSYTHLDVYKRQDLVRLLYREISE